MLKKLLIFISIAIFFTSCKKDTTHCYECDLNYNNSGVYQEMGCMTAEEWSKIAVTDYLGNDINKKTRCKIK